MTQILFVAPAAPGIGLTSVCLGLVHALDSIGLRVAFCKPIQQNSAKDLDTDHTSQLLQSCRALNTPTPLDMQRVRSWLTQDNQAQVLEAVVERVEQARLCVTGGADVVIVEALVTGHSELDGYQLNSQMAQALNADVILVDTSANSTLDDLIKRLELAASTFGGHGSARPLGCILNRCCPTSLGQDQPSLANVHEQQLFKSGALTLLGCIPDNPRLSSPRCMDLALFLGAKLINEGAYRERRVHNIVLAAQNEAALVTHLTPGALVVMPGDRDALLVTACLAALTGNNLAGLLLTEGCTPSAAIQQLCQPAFDQGLPVLSVASSTHEILLKLDSALNMPLPIDDKARTDLTMDFVAAHIDTVVLRKRLNAPHVHRLSPAAFRYQLSERARHANKRIVLPESDDPRIVQAAVLCCQRRIARCVLLGNPADIRRLAQAHGIELPDSLELLDPTPYREKFLKPLLKLRQHKGLSEERAQQALEDNVVVGTLMMVFNEADGLVSGATHTTANTLRPALQLIKTRPGVARVSSVFFMCLPEQVLVYGDCAINPDPSAEQLADIALQSAESARAFGIEPRVAMISYATGDSGSGADVDKVKKATELARQQRPDLLIDGPLQYDAAAIESVAQQKAPNSAVAGRATVFVFPDLNTGNTTYKAVQRSAHVVSIGPMVQGLAKPVNDLSRGATVEDIVYTIALTAIQADSIDCH